MNPTDQQRFDVLYEAMQQALRLQGAADKTRDAYLRAVRRSTEFFDRPPDTFRTGAKAKSQLDPFPLCIRAQ